MTVRLPPGKILTATLVACAVLILCGCEILNTLEVSGVSLGTGGLGRITTGQFNAVRKLGESFRDITPEQEYYIGRSVAATLAADYHPWSRAAAEDYLNVLGQTLARFSDLPQTFGGYHFLVLDSDEINAFAAPGGLILVTRGMLRCCPDEESVAAVLAHEIGHVQYRHGLQAIKKNRLSSAFAVLGTETAKAYGSSQLAALTSAFEGSVQDAVTAMTNIGYSRAFEREADAAAVTILRRSGYNPAALVTMLTEMKRRLTPGASGFGKTHPAPDDRVEELQPLLQGAAAAPPAGKAAATRQQRLTQALKGV
jgi:predicted Zn-dependent protease